MKHPLETGEGTYTTREVAEYLRVHYHTVVRACQRGQLPAFKIGGTWRISAPDLREYIKGAFGAYSPALRQAPNDATLKGKPRQRRAPLPPRPRGADAQNQYTKRKEAATQ